VLLGCALRLSRPTAPEPRWFKGNTHTHTLWSDGQRAPELAVGWYREHGYDFLVLSDHNVLLEGERWVRVEDEGPLTPEQVREIEQRFGAGAVELRAGANGEEMRLQTLGELRDRFEAPGEFLLIQGEEITDAAAGLPVHVNGLGLRELVSPQGGATPREAMQRDVDAVLAQGERLRVPVLAHVNHPNFGFGLSWEDVAALSGERFFEVANGHGAVKNAGDATHSSTEAMWDLALVKRLTETDLGLLYGLATDDSHEASDGTTSPPGRGWIVVRARELSNAALFEALRRGDFYASSGVELADVGVHEGVYRVEVRPRAGEHTRIRFVGARLAPDGRVIEPGEILEEVEGSSAAHRLREDELYVRAVVLSDRRLAADAADVDRAWCQPVLGPAAVRVPLAAALSPVEPPAPYGPVPTAGQLAWHALEFTAFLHFTTNTFTDREWGEGDESPALFQPTDFDARAIVGVLADAGMRGVILTCKHHDGFCLWPTDTTAHSVKSSPWLDGKGDVVGAIAEAARERGLEFGVYLSPWDRNHPEYGRPAYIDVYRAQLRELLTRYGRIFELWCDGANGGSGFYGGAREVREIDRTSYYDWPNTWKLADELQPGIVIFSDVGPGVRWVGNESGAAGDPCWATYTPEPPQDAPGREPAPGFVDSDRGFHGDRDGRYWMPAEVDVSIRPGWFYHASEDERVRSSENLVELYFQSVGRGAGLLLNVPPDRRGRIHERDAEALAGMRARLDAIFGIDLAREARVEASQERGGGDARFAAANAVDGERETYWATDDGVTTPTLELRFDSGVEFDVVSLREHLPLGQRIDGWALDAWDGDAWREFARGQSIGNRYLWRGERQHTDRVRLRILSAAVSPALAELALHRDPTRDR
jgi:alpha-L-fucosidase